MSQPEPKQSGTTVSRGPLPTLPEFIASLAARSADDRALLLWDDQSLRWQAGERPTVEMYTQYLPAPLAPDLLLDLIYGEFVLRQQAGENPTTQEYQNRFPRHAGEIGRQLSLHQAFSDAEITQSAQTPPQTTSSAGGADADLRAASAWPGSTAPGPSLPCAHSPPTTQGNDEPTEIAGYKIIASLGAGGQGVVYRGVHPTLGRDVVVKLGREQVSAVQETDALIQEGRILAELDDPGLARIFDLRLHQGRVCLVMEYIRGRHLEQDARDRPRNPMEAAALVARVARALAAAHRRGVLHRDIKPRNIIIDEAGNPRLIDFGLARLEDAWRQRADEGGLSGTVAFMAPEQARAEPPTPRSDVFALGGLLYFLLTGQAPFRGSGFTEVLTKARSCEWDRTLLANARIPARLRAVVERTLAADPSVRPATAEELAGELEKISRPRRIPWLMAAAAALVIAIVGLGVWLAVRPAPDPEPRPPVQPPGANHVVAEVKRPFSMQVRVWRAKRYVDLVDCLPVSNADEVRVETVAPAGLHATLFLWSNSGQLEKLASSPRATDDRPLSFPEKAGKAAPLNGPAGNELILLCARSSAPVAVDDLRDLLAGVSTWPKLPEDAALGLSPTGVKVLLKSRGLGTPTDRPDPQGEVQQRLEELQRRLRPHFDHFEAMIFSHTE